MKLKLILGGVAVLSMLGAGCADPRNAEIEKLIQESNEILDKSTRTRREAALTLAWFYGRRGMDWSDFTNQHGRACTEAMKSRHE